MKKKIIVAIIICLQAALHTTLYAPIYDLTKNPSQAHQEWDEYKIKGNKSFSVKNNLDRKEYVRIGYKGPVGPVCEYTGFVLNPGQTGKVLKSPICQPYIVSSGTTSIKPWNGHETRLGDFMWTIEKKFCPHNQNPITEEISYKGKWTHIGVLDSKPKPKDVYDWEHRTSYCKTDK
jgi:hypothetical protein